MIKDRKQILFRSYILGVVLLFMAIAIVCQLINIQVNKKDEYLKFATKNNFRNDTVQAKRGNLYAANGELLATSITKYDICLDLVTIKKSLFEDSIVALSDSLGRMFLKPSSYFEEKLRTERKRKNQCMNLVKGLSFNDFKRIKTFPIFKKGQIKGGFIVKRPVERFLPVEDIGARTLGYDDARGKAGLEGAYSTFLRGVDGHRLEQFLTGRQWKPVNDWNDIEPIEGSDVYTTIDINFQDVAFHSLEKQLIDFEADHGCVIVMEVATGQIKAMANLQRMPDGSYLDKRNFAVWEANEPGSTFKLISLMAGLEDQVIDTTTMVDTSAGVLKISGKKITDTHLNGRINLMKVFEESSNVGTVKLIYQNYKNNPRRFVNRLYQWGLNKKLNIDIPGEGTPYIPHPDESGWSPLTLPWMAYGYNLKMTPLQLLTFYNAVANNGTMVKPLFVNKIEKKGVASQQFEPQVIIPSIASKETIGKAQKMLEGVVKNGTAKSLYVPAYPMAGKTGTAQAEYWVKKQARQYRSSFCGYFPAKNPKYSCIVVISKPSVEKGYYGAEVAGPVFKAIAMSVYINTPQRIPTTDMLVNVTERINNKANLDLNLNSKTMPNTVGYNGYEAIAMLENLGLTVKYTGVGRVKNQSIPVGQYIQKGTIIYLELV